MLRELLDVLTFQAGYNATVVLLGTTFLGVSAGMIGTLALLRKRALLSDALAHCSLPGLCSAFLVLAALELSSRSHAALLAGATLSGLIGICCIQFLTRLTRLREDAVIGIVLSVFFGVGILLLSIIQNLGDAGGGGLHHFIYGQTATMRLSDAYLTGFSALGGSFICLLLLKEFRLLCFDSDFAAVQGWPVSVLDLILMVLIVMITTIGLQSVGLILIVALLIIPAAGAHFWTERLHWMMFIAAGLGGLSGYLGAALSSSYPHLPAGAVIVLTSGSFFLISFLFAPQRGLLVATTRHLSLRFRILEDHVVRDLYESAQAERLKSGLPLEFVQRLIPLQSRVFANFIILLLQRKGVVQREKQVISLTPRGQQKAQALVRNNRLWEQYLIEHADYDSLHVDRSADIVEHLLSPEVVSRLEAQVTQGSSRASVDEEKDRYES